MTAIPFIRKDHVPLGILYMTGATLMFAISSGLSKWQVAAYPFSEVLFLRAVMSLAICGLLILPRTGLAAFRTKRLRDHIGRSTTQSVAQTFIILAFGLMPLAGAVAINFSAPLFAALFAALYLKEKVGLARGGALVVGFVGVLLVAAPGADSFRLGALYAVGNAVLLGSVTAAVRGMTKTESVETLTMFQMLILTCVFGLSLTVFGFTWPASGTDWGAMLVNGVFNGLGQYWWTRSLALAPTSAVGPFYYFSLVWAMLIGFMFWGDIPTLGLLAGSAVVVGSGLFLLWHESGKKLAPISADEPLPD